MTKTTRLDHDDHDEIAELLTGRRIATVNEDSETLELDDGTIVKVVPNDGGCSCGAGDYFLKALGATDAAITRAEVIVEDAVEGQEYGETRYRIQVYAAGVPVNAVVIEGDDGNGYYGTGFQLIVSPASAS